jgi:hypothetical protein
MTEKMTAEKMTTEHAIEQDIQETRAQLGETVAQLAAKADLKARAQVAADKLTDRARIGAGQVKTQALEVKRQAVQHRQQLTGRPAQIATAAVVLVVLMLAWRKRR